ncbi:sigma-54-dependent Fis family transcriptional regulator [candidate division KSB1 bacterium]|nr:sigma-54-dependent Fis family transcriptional regulator [candidate division KSB1 bacterium]
MNVIFQRIRQAAASDINVFVLGESGTGKDLIAQAIHRHSKRAHGPFLPINMGAIARELVASELFGHQKGSFTGATATKIGSFEQANGGTIFLDEISTMDESIQVSLLRVLETSKFQRIGGKRFIKSDVRIIAASNEKLLNLDDIHESKLREDLYHRLSVFTIEIPPLRSRGSDIQILARYFLKQANAEFDSDIAGFHDEVMRVFQTYPWPGNVRELKNIVQRAAIICKSKNIKLEHIPERIRTTSHKPAQALTVPIGLPLSTIEKLVIQQTLEFTNGNRTRAAEILGISRRALYNKIALHKLCNKITVSSL